MIASRVAERLEDRTLLTAYFVDTPDDVVAPDGVISLREAIMAANTNMAVNEAPAGSTDGDDIRFDADLAGATITLQHGQFVITEDLAIIGDDDALPALGITIDANNTDRLFHINTAERVVISYLTLESGNPLNAPNPPQPVNGGAILVDGGGGGGGDHHFAELIIRNSTADAGGAIAVSDSTVTFFNSVVEDNSAVGSGGAVANFGGVILSGGSRFISNSAGDSGGAIYSEGGRVGLFGDTRLIDNEAMGGAIGQGGGGLFATNTDVDMGSVRIEANRASGTDASGGGVSISGGTTNISTSHFSDNWANRSGGALQLTGVSASLLATVVDSNDAGVTGTAAPGDGGGIHVAGAGSAVRLVAVSVTNNEAAGSGGGIWIDGGSQLATESSSSVTSNRAFGSSPSAGGGGVFSNGGILKLTDTLVVSNVAVGDQSRGGGIHSAGGEVSVSGSSIISTNRADLAGGGIALIGGTLAFEQSSLEFNAAGRDFQPFPGFGGGLFNEGGSVVMSEALIGNNVAVGFGPDGGGGGIYNTGMMTIANSTISDNRTTSMDGGGVLNAGGMFRINDSVITGNSAGRFGGGFENRGGDLRIDTNQTTFNSAGVAGGGVHVTGTANTVLDRGEVSNNTAGEEGGGLWNSSTGIMKLFDGVNVNDNVASGDGPDQGGGGIFNDGDGTTGGRLALEDIIISRNIADGAEGSGGGVLSINGVVTLLGTRVLDNVANRAGGGIELVSGILELTDATVDTNAALGGGMGSPGDGGGIHVTGRSGQVGRINIIGGSVSGNTAARQGGGLWNQQGNIMVVRGGAVVDGNTASGDAAEDGGGGIFNRGGRLSVGEGAVISNNVADGAAGSGGGIFSTGSAVSIAGGTVISGNSANRAGGGIEVIDGLVTVNDSTIENNTAGQGGGVNVTGTNFTRVDLWNAIVQGNSAAGQGGGLWNQANGVMLVRVGSQVTGNTASGDAADDGGGGIYNQGGRLIINNATIDGNHADGTAGSGGGVFTRNGVVTVENAAITNNTAHRAGGGVEIIDGWFFTRNMDLTGNNAGDTAPNPGDGGGLHVTGTNLTRVRIDGGTIADNTASGSGGGLWHQAGSLMVIFGGTTIDGNTAAGDAAGAGGGGIFNAGGRLAITAATLSGNSASGTNGAGGGILSLGGGLTLDNSTVSGNSANDDGGGIVSNGDFIAANATIVGNRSDADGAGGGSGGGLFNGGLATINNTIVAGNLVGTGSAASDVAGNNLRPVSAHSIVGDAASAGGLVNGTNGNIVGNAGVGVLALATIIDPTLADNGGPTLTHALAQNSPAINAGNNNLAEDVAGMAFEFDQRGIGFPRIVNETVDIGAVEA